MKIEIEVDVDLIPWIIDSLNNCIENDNTDDDMFLRIERQELINDLENIWEDEEDYEN